MEMSALIAKGGPVMWVLLAYSFIAVAIVIERVIHFQRLPKYNPDFSDETTKGRCSPELAIVRGIKAASAEGIQDLERVASRIGSEQVAKMESGLRTLAWLGNTAPLLGLFGTITGMIKAFMVIEQAGGKVDAQALAGGIWEAMVTTGAGLAVAIPVLLLLHILEGLVDRRAKSMQSVASLIVEKLPHRPQQQAHDEVKHTPSLAHAV